MANYSTQISNIAGLFGGMGAPQMNQAQQQLAQKQAADKTMFDQLGITNPLLQQFGQQVANVAGRDTRSASQAMASLLQNADTNTPEGRKAVIAAVSRVDPLKAMQLSEQFKKSDLDADVARTTMALREQQLINEKNKSPLTSAVIKVPMFNEVGEPKGYTYKTIQYSKDADGNPIVTPEVREQLEIGTVVDSVEVGSPEWNNQASYYKGRNTGKRYFIKNRPDGRFEVYDTANEDAEPRIITFVELGQDFERIVKPETEEKRVFDSSNPEQVAVERAKASMGRGDRISF